MRQSGTYRILSLFLVVMLCIGLPPVRSQAAVSNPAKGNFETVLKNWNKSGNTGLKKAYKGAYQCAAFSRYAFVSLYGHTDGLSNKKNKVRYVLCKNESELLSSLKKYASRGDAIRISRYYGTSFSSWSKDKGKDSEYDTHIMILQDISASGSISVYESNFNKKDNKGRGYTYSSAKKMASDNGRKKSRVSASFNKANQRVLLKIIHAKENNNTPSSLSANGYVINNGTYSLAPQVDLSMRLDIYGASVSKGGNAQIWKANKSNAQKFTFTYLNNGYYRVICKCSGLALDVYGGSTEKGTNVQQWTQNNSAAQQWKIVSAGGGYYCLIPRTNSGMRLDVYGAKNANGTNVQIWTANNSKAQKWKLSAQ